MNVSLKNDMKYISLFMLFAIFIVTSCTKSHEENAGIINKSITGTWNYTQRFYSLGGPLVYESTTQLRQRITFYKVGKLSSDIPAFKNFDEYTIIDSIRVKLSSVSQMDRLYFFKIDSVKNSLTLSPADNICTEGCGDIFQR